VKADVADIDYDIAFDRFGLDSVSAVEMTRELSAWLNEELAPTLLYDYPTIDLLSAHLASQLRSANV
jgi:acyl carrier protein